MRNIILLFGCINMFLVSCSATKTTATTTTISESSREANYGKATETSNNSLSSVELNYHINRLISHQLSIPVSFIARSGVRKTDSGYLVNFLNVKTGEKYIFSTDFNFSSVEITKESEI